MNFYIIFVLIIILNETKTDSNPELLVTRTGIDNASPCSVGIVFFVTLNNTSAENDYDVELTPDRCCLEEEFEDCDVLQIVGTCRAFIPMGTTQTLKLVAPILDPFEREGYCDVYLDSKLNQQRNKRNVIKINFDTTIRHNGDRIINSKRCLNKDEDPLNDCKPINCERFYNGKKTFYNRSLQKCIEAPVCITVDDEDYSELIYNTLSNKCEKRSLNKDDIHVLKSYANNNRKNKDIIMIQKHPINVTVDDMDALDVIDFETSTHKRHASKVNEVKMRKIEKVKNVCLKILILNYLKNNKWTLIVLGLVILVQCICIGLMMYCFTKVCDCFKDKKVVRKYFNYRQDVSVTTPLIGTSNIDTDTTDFHNLTESSVNREQKIKCYKACQKERPEAVKQCLSDDILSKCLNRRNWKNHQKSDIIPEVHNISEDREQLREPVINKNYISDTEIASKETKKPIESRVVFEDEKPNINTPNKQKVVTIGNSYTEMKDIEDKSNGGIEKNSEKEIKCHSYECINTSMTGSKLNSVNKSRLFRADKSRKDTISIDKGAQAYFSNDSIEDFLSERGLVYLANENLSKYTFSEDSNEGKPIASSISNKTSKNFIKNVLSLLHKRSRQGPLSDPGKYKNKDLEILHMSRATVYSTSNESDCATNLQRGDSRTSF